jgi:predicted CoA-substrate-specific enzyme activase
MTLLVAGVDIGSTTAKTVLIKDNIPVSSAISWTGADCNAAAEESLEAALKGAGAKRSDLKYIVSTGYGRRAINFGNETITEISANAKGAIYLGSEKGKIKTIIDVGGQDTKVIVLDDQGRITNFIMNDKCAAGTGRFLDVIARSLQEPLDNFINLSLKTNDPVTINSTCTVFAESEVISLIAKRVPKERIIAGLHKSIASRIVNLAKTAGIKPVVFFDGGGAKNIALKKAIEQELGYEIYVTKEPQIVVALGAAIIANEKMARKVS